MKLVLAAAALALAATPALADPRLADGTYTCTMEQYTAGFMEIAGDTYQGPAFNKEYEGTYAFRIDDANNIFWDGPVGGYTDDGYTLIASRLVTDSDDNVGIEIAVKQDGSEAHHYVQCFQGR